MTKTVDRVTLPSGKTYDAEWAAVAIGNDVFSAKLPAETSVVDIVTDFAGADPIIVDNPLTGRKIYEGYTVFESLRSMDGGIIITLGRGDTA